MATILAEHNTPEAEQERYWQAVQQRDAASDGSFVYAVRSTGIYCRPSCSSRQPLRANVAFFALPAGAELAGFRACKRCKPQSVEPADPITLLVAQVCQLIEQQLADSPSLEDLGAQVGMSPHHLQRVFKRLVGISPREYADTLRVTRLKGHLRAGESVSEAIYAAGYGSPSRVYERADAQLGMSPALYQSGGKGMQITYTVVGSQLGRLLVAATERGVCAVSLADDDATLEKNLQAEYPRAQIGRNDAELGEFVRAILEYLSGEIGASLKLPIDVQATAFQRQVWQALQNIPYGETRSYQNIAETIGNPKAVRAVATACANNHVAMVVPCHRVVGSDGKLHGFRWGLERKRALLDLEQGKLAETTTGG